MIHRVFEYISRTRVVSIMNKKTKIFNLESKIKKKKLTLIYCSSETLQLQKSCLLYSQTRELLTKQSWCSNILTVRYTCNLFADIFNCNMESFWGTLRILVGKTSLPKSETGFQIERDKRDFRAASRTVRAFAVAALLVRKLSVGSSGRTAR